MQHCMIIRDPYLGESDVLIQSTGDTGETVL